jgi:hypothetical protein
MQRKTARTPLETVKVEAGAGKPTPRYDAHAESKAPIGNDTDPSHHLEDHANLTSASPHFGGSNPFDAASL